MSIFDGREHRLETLPAEAQELQAARSMKWGAASALMDDELDIDSLLSEGGNRGPGAKTIERAGTGAKKQDKGAKKREKAKQREQARKLKEQAKLEKKLAKLQEKKARERRAEMRRAAKVQKPKKESKGVSTLIWSFLILVLIAALVGQYGYYHRLELSQHLVLRRAFVEICGIVGCEVPPRRKLSAIEFLDRQVRSHPKVKGALLITGTFVNRADFAQSYPTIKLLLRDISGNVVASRDFQPTEYLSQNEPLFSAGEEAELILEVRDPGKNAVSFEFSFL